MMDKQKVIGLKEDAQNRARILYDQRNTLRSQLKEVDVELERTRGDFRAYSNILDTWQETEVKPKEKDK